MHILEPTADGSATLFVPSLNEHYHSVKGARTEAEHTYIRMALEASRATEPRVLEVGLGTGLNAWLSLCTARCTGRTLHYTAVELHPLTWDEVQPLGYSNHPLFRALHEAPWDAAENFIDLQFGFRKLHVNLLSWLPTAPSDAFDVVYFDAFAPEKQPELWTASVFAHLYRLLSPGGCLTTYCAKGVVRRTLQEVGFTVERLPGPPGGKREMLRGNKLDSVTSDKSF